MKICVECKHHEKLIVVYCKHPKVAKISMVTGHIQKEYADLERANSNTLAHCGVEGKLWEPKPPAPIEQPKKPWYKFWQR